MAARRLETHADVAFGLILDSACRPARRRDERITFD
jgi:hypothetical protein